MQPLGRGREALQPGRRRLTERDRKMLDVVALLLRRLPRRGALAVRAAVPRQVLRCDLLGAVEQLPASGGVPQQLAEHGKSGRRGVIPPIGCGACPRRSEKSSDDGYRILLEY